MIQEPPANPPILASRIRRYQRLLGAVAILWVLCEFAATRGVSLSPLYLAYVNVLAMGVPFHVYAIAGVFFLHVWSNPGSDETVRTAVVGGGVLVLLELLKRAFHWPIPLNSTACLSFGFASLGMLSWRAWRTTGLARAQTLLVLLPACLVVAFVSLNLFFLNLSTDLNPTTYDAQVYAADAGLGLQWSFVLGQVFEAAPALATVANLVYATLPIAFLFVLANEMRSPASPPVDLFTAFLGIALSGYSIYMLFPVVGPVYVFEGLYPHSPPTVQEALSKPWVIPDQARNCMPSLHTAWALLICWHSRGLGMAVRFVTGIYLFFTVLATLGFGLHYMLDLIVAVPFAAAVQAACSPTNRTTVRLQLLTLLSMTGLTVLWLMVISSRLDWLLISPVLTNAAAILTVTVSVLAERELDRKSRRGALATARSGAK